MGIGLREVAAAAGVSTITASRALTGSSLVAEKTRHKVFEASLRCAYRPHHGARALRARRFNAVGLLLSTEHSFLPQALLDGFSDALETRNQALLVMRLADEHLTDPKFAPRVLTERMVDGLLINYTVEIPTHLIQQIRAHHLPSIWVNIKEPSDCVYPDMFAGAKATVRHLIDLGHRHIAYVDFVNDLKHPGPCHYSVKDAWNGCREAIENAGSGSRLSHLERVCVKREGRPELARTLLTEPGRPTAIFAASSGHALTCLHAAYALGLRVPEDLSIVTYHHTPSFNESGLAFDTVTIPEFAMGSVAVSMLMDKLAQPMAPLPSVSLPMTFTPGMTCDRAPRLNVSR